MRIDKEDLERAVEHLNSISRRKYKLQCAYGGCKLVVTFKDSSVISDVTYGYTPKSELYYAILGMMNYSRSEKSPARLRG